MSGRLTLAMALASVMITGVLQAQVSPPAQAVAVRTVWDGLYSEGQAARGQTAYNRACAECHMIDLSGHEYAGALAGFGFLLKWQDASVAELFGRVRTMPIGAVGTVTLQEQLDILAYLFQRNGYPAGNEELTLAVAARRWPRIPIERRRH